MTFGLGRLSLARLISTLITVHTSRGFLCSIHGTKGIRNLLELFLQRPGVISDNSCFVRFFNTGLEHSNYVLNVA